MSKRPYVVFSCVVMLGIGGLLAYLAFRPISLRTALDVPEPCLGNTPEECIQKCGLATEKGTFSFRGATQSYQDHSYGPYRVAVLFYEGLAHVIIYSRGGSTSSGMMRLSALDEGAEEACNRLATANLKGDDCEVEKNSKLMCITYRGTRSGITVATMPLMSNIVIASTALGHELMEAYNKEHAPSKP